MILGVLQARMSSTRLPGKVLMPLAGVPMVLRQIERLRQARKMDRPVVATSTDYAFVAAVFDALNATRSDFSTSDVRALVHARPDLASFGGHRRI